MGVKISRAPEGNNSFPNLYIPSPKNFKSCPVRLFLMKGSFIRYISDSSSCQSHCIYIKNAVFCYESIILQKSYLPAIQRTKKGKELFEPSIEKLGLN